MSCNCRGNCGNQVGGAQTYPCKNELNGVKKALMALERCLIAAAEEEEEETPRPCRCRCCCCPHRCGGSRGGNQTTWGR